MSFIWSPILKLLDDYAAGAASHPDLWTSALVVITQTLTCDEGGPWFVYVIGLLLKPSYSVLARRQDASTGSCAGQANSHLRPTASDGGPDSIGRLSHCHDGGSERRCVIEEGEHRHTDAYTIRRGVSAYVQSDMRHRTVESTWRKVTWYAYTSASSLD